MRKKITRALGVRLVCEVRCKVRLGRYPELLRLVDMVMCTYLVLLERQETSSRVGMFWA